MRSDNFLRSVAHTNRVYEFMTVLFLYLDNFDYRKVKSCYAGYLRAVDVGIENRLNTLMDVLEDYYYGGFDEWKDAWIKVYENAWLEKYPKEIIIPLRTLVKIDGLIRQLIISKDANRIRVGPLNTNDTECYLFLKKPEGFFTEGFHKAKIRIGRNTIGFMTDSCNSLFKSIVFVKKSYLMEYEPEVFYYKAEDDSILSMKKKIRVAYAPFLKQDWFLAEFDDDLNEFEIIQDESKIDLIQNTFMRILDEADRKGANIVIFPELALHPTCEEVLMEYLYNRTFRNLKLCFFGSLWQEMSNTSLLATSSGTVLARQRKKNPYEHFDKEKNKGYRERITVTDKRVVFIDIEGIGRIAYYICADINAGEIKTLSAVMQVDFIIVSAYTSSTDTMMNSAKSQAVESGTATVLCNAYSAAIRKEGQEALQAFCVIPRAKNKQLNYKILSQIDHIRIEDFGNNDWKNYYSDIELT